MRREITMRRQSAPPLPAAAGSRPAFVKQNDDGSRWVSTSGSLSRQDVREPHVSRETKRWELPPGSDVARVDLVVYGGGGKMKIEAGITED